MKEQLGFLIDFSRCSGCFACMVACQDEKDLPDSISFRHVVKLEKGRYPLVKFSFITLSCLHCGDAPCIIVCPTGAIRKRDEDGIVVVDQNLCIGCHSCALACPFGAPQYPDGKKMDKCDFCLKRIEAGLEPACVRICPTRAISFGPIEKLEREVAEKASRTILGSR